MSEHVWVVGEALVDVVRDADGTSEVHPGGSPANVALGLARLGRRAELITSLGDDDHGRLVRAHLSGSGVIVRSGTPAASTSVATAHLDAHGVATYEFDLAWVLPADAAATPDPVALHTGSIGAVLEPGGADVLAMMRRMRPTATITYDPNARPALMGDPVEAAAAIEARVAESDVVKVSDEDLAWLYPGTDPADVAREWLTGSPALVVVTRGGEGVTAFGAFDEVHVASEPVTVADTVGAGDSFMGGLIDGLWERGLLGASARARLAALDQATIAALLARCARIAAITVSRAGANPPTSAELAAAAD